LKKCKRNSQPRTTIRFLKSPQQPKDLFIHFRFTHTGKEYPRKYRKLAAGKGINRIKDKGQRMTAALEPDEEFVERVKLESDKPGIGSSGFEPERGRAIRIIRAIYAMVKTAPPANFHHFLLSFG